MTLACNPFPLTVSLPILFFSVVVVLVEILLFTSQFANSGFEFDSISFSLVFRLKNCLRMQIHDFATRTFSRLFMAFRLEIVFVRVFGLEKHILLHFMFRYV